MSVKMGGWLNVTSLDQPNFTLAEGKKCAYNVGKCKHEIYLPYSRQKQSKTEQSLQWLDSSLVNNHQELQLNATENQH